MPVKCKKDGGALEYTQVESKKNPSKYRLRCVKCGAKYRIDASNKKSGESAGQADLKLDTDK